MKTYEITAEVDTMDSRIGDVTARGFLTVPPFYVVAASQADARELAEDIIDPVHMTGVRITIREARIPGVRELREDLDLAAEALAGDDPVTWHEALQKLARGSAYLTGLDWDTLMRPFSIDDDEDEGSKESGDE